MKTTTNMIAELVNMNERPMAVPAPVRRRANAALSKLGNYSDNGLPLEMIFDCCKHAGLIPLQEDGCEWSGLCGGAECGSEEARQQVCIFQLAMWDDRTGCHRLTKLGLNLSWGTLYRNDCSRRWEFVAYVN